MRHTDEVDLNAAAVTHWLRARFTGVEGPRAVPGRLAWDIAPGGEREPFQIRISFESLQTSIAAIRESLGFITFDARTHAPATPGFYDVTPAGVAVLGMSEFNFELYGQEIRCYRDPETEAGGEAPAGTGAAVWRVEHEGVARPATMPAGMRDTREAVTAWATQAILADGSLRVPDPPWSWSIRVGGAEWWARLETPNLAVRVLLLRERARGEEHRVPWPADRQAPSRRELVRALEGLQN